jgi:hypothetical protein
MPRLAQAPPPRRPHSHAARAPRKCQPLRIVLDPDQRPIGKGALCAQAQAFNLQAATRVAANDKAGRERLCRYILRPPLANDRLHVLPEGSVRLFFKKPWSDGTASVDLEPLALIGRLAALVPPPRRHITRYCGVLSSHSSSRSLVVPKPTPETEATPAEKPTRKSRYIPWAELLRRTFAIESKCGKCGGRLRLIALIKTGEVIEKLLVAMHLPADVPELHPARPPPTTDRAAREEDDWLN